MAEERITINRTGQAVAEFTERQKARAAAKLEAAVAAKQQTVAIEETVAPAPAVAEASPAEPVIATVPEEPKTEEPNVVLSPPLEIKAERLAAAEAAMAEEREAPPPHAPPASKKKRWCWLSTSCLGLILVMLFCAVVVGVVTVWWVKKYPNVTNSGKPTIATVTAPAPAPTVPPPTVPQPPTVTAVPPAFVGPPGWIVCQPASAFSGCDHPRTNVAINGERADWSRPVVVCANGEARGEDRCACRVCKRIPNSS